MPGPSIGASCPINQFSCLPSNAEPGTSHRKKATARDRIRVRRRSTYADISMDSAGPALRVTRKGSIEPFGGWPLGWHSRDERSKPGR